MNAPNGRAAFLTAEWRYLVMLNFEVPSATLLPFVPRGTTLDAWNGRVLASVVGFRFLDTRVLGVPIPFHRDFDEVNLRFYVRRELPSGEVRRGVVFIRELVPRKAIAWIARLAYNEPYSALPMRSRTPARPTDTPGTVQYEWRRRSWEHLAATSVGTPLVAAPGSEAQFITEHYWGYTRQRDGATVEYEVSHPPWRVWEAHRPALLADVASLYGQGFVEPLTTTPCSAFVAEGSPITVYRPRRLS
jgi:hypothetical protein